MPLASTARLSMDAAAAIELALHQAVHQMDQGDPGAGLGEPIGGFEPKQTAADDDDARRPCGRQARSR